MHRWILPLLVAAAVAAPRGAEAKPKEKYYFEISSVDLADGVPAEVGDRVRTQMLAEFAKHDIILAELPAGAPDPGTASEQFKKYIKKRHIRAFKIKVDVTEYTRKVVPMPDGRRGQRLEVSVSLRMFGETIPDRGLGFAGAGSAAIKLEIGKKVRKADDDEAHAAAFEPAVADAVDESLRKLQLPPPSQQNKKRKKRSKK